MQHRGRSHLAHENKSRLTRRDVRCGQIARSLLPGITGTRFPSARDNGAIEAAQRLAEGSSDLQAHV